MCVLVALGAAACVGDADPRHPNIILIIGDDYGYPYHGFTGSKQVHTPNLDQLAADGTTFTLAHTTASVCRPSLVTLLTGLYPYQWDRYLKGAVAAGEAIERVPTLPRLLEERGYVSFQGGKYWEGTYDRAGFTEGMTRSTRDEAERVYGAAIGPSGGAGFALARPSIERVESFLDRYEGEPFFVWFAPYLPHAPFDAPAEFRRPYEGRGYSESAVKYYANCTRLDHAVGALLASLESRGLRENTLVIYLSDNGWDQEPDADHGLLRAIGGPRGKLSMHDQGFRTPIVFNWPEQIPEGKQVDELVSTVDLLPTLLDYVGQPRPPELRGHSLRPLIEGEPQALREAIVGSMSHVRVSADRPRTGASPIVNNERAYWARTREWHYVWYRDRNSEELYPMQSGLDANVAAAHPEVARALRKRIESWEGLR